MKKQNYLFKILNQIENEIEFEQNIYNQIEKIF
jgi:hypothetical protein